MSRPLVSVALCCYNGALFVRQQVESILAQSMPVDEIVVCDDGSSDNTPEIVATLAAQSAVPLALHRNSRRLGSTGNFELAISLTRGDIVFLSDQDDLWYPAKVQDMVREFGRREDLLLLHSDARLVNARVEPLGLTLFEGLEVTRWERTQLHSGGAFGALVRRNLVTGATVAFRREVFELARPFPREWVHDEWLGLIAAATGSVDFLEYPLIDYRQHGENLIGVPLLSWYEKLWRVMHAGGDYHHKLEHRAKILFDRLQALENRVPPERREWGGEKLLHAHVRGHLPSNRWARLPIVLQEVGTGRYHRCSPGWRTVARDLIAPIHTTESVCAPPKRAERPDWRPTSKATMDNAATMRTVPRPACPVCKTAGEPAYSDLRDGVFGTAGTWSMRRCLNRRCGLLWLDPAPDARDLALAYDGYYTHADSPDDLRSPLRMGVRREMVARMLGYPSPEDRRARLLGKLLLCSPRHREYVMYGWLYLPFVRGGRVLEVGCGAGAQLATLRDSGWTTLGVEFDVAAAAAARSRGLEILDGELQALALPAASFDAIVMAHVIEHVPDPVGLFAECRRLLKPEGLLVAITPNVDSLGHRLFAHNWRGLEPPRHLAVFTAPALALCARQAGFERLQVTTSARDAANVMLASSRIAQVAPGERIESPRAGAPPPLRFRTLEHLERAFDVLGTRLGEELVLVAHPGAPAPRATS